MTSMRERIRSMIGVDVVVVTLPPGHRIVGNDRGAGIGARERIDEDLVGAQRNARLPVTRPRTVQCNFEPHRCHVRTLAGSLIRQANEDHLVTTSGEDFKKLLSSAKQ